jgi:P-type Cu2+ transporter
VPEGASLKEFCCAGCEAVHGLLQAQGLSRYYTLAEGRTAPAPEPRRDRSFAWLEPLVARSEATSSPVCALELDVQGIHCAACVWLFEELFRRTPGGVALDVNPARGTLALTATAGFPLGEFVAALERFGYRLGPRLKPGERRSDGLLVRTAICLALAGNAMMFATAIYLGLAEGPIYRLFGALELALASAAVAIGGPVFFRSAVHALRRGVLHLDLPISLGIALAYAGSLWAHLAGRPEAIYFDTLTVFVALMLLGRWLQQRVVEQNRDRLLVSDGAEGLLCRRIDRGRVEIAPATGVAAGDRLLIAPGDLVPVDAVLATEAASLSLDWVTGESAPRTFAAGERVPAGAFNLGTRAVEVLAAEPFAVSRLTSLLGRDRADDDGGAHSGGLARAVAGWYVTAVLAAAAIGAVGWLVATGDVDRALVVATSVLIITCPCAFGIAAPLAWELCQAGLRRAGLYVRRASFLDRAQHVRRIVFDKTGTLTTGVPELVDPAALDALAPADRAALYDLAARSNHPRSQAVARALDGRLRPGVAVDERPGLGLAATIDGAVYRLGAPGFVTAAGADRDDPELLPLAFGKDGALLVALDTREAIRPDAARELSRLAEDHELWVLSGDRPARVAAIAAAVGVPASRSLGGFQPEDKAAFLADLDRGDTLFIGDGVNDALAARAAHAAGTPAIDRPFMAAMTDFYLVTPGLSPIATALRAAAALGRTLRRNFAVAVAYNVVGVALAWAGLLGPLGAAVLMPASSLAIVGLTTWSLSPRSPLWRSSSSSSS